MKNYLIVVGLCLAIPLLNQWGVVMLSILLVILGIVTLKKPISF